MIRDADPYTGVRITVPARIDRARHLLRIDVNVGDPVTPLETVLAEKIVTMIDRGDATTRDRDFADVCVLTGRHEVDAQQLAAAIQATGAHRGSELRPIRSVLVDLATARQAEWARFLARRGLDDAAPALLADAIRAVAEFADPVIVDDVDGGVWDPVARRWRGGATANVHMRRRTSAAVDVLHECNDQP